MPLETQTYLSEIMIRFNANSEVTGAHKVTISQVIDTDDNNKVIAQRGANTVPLSSNDLQTVLDPVNGALVEQVNILTTERDEALANAASLESKDAEIASLQAQITSLQNQLNPPVQYKPLSAVQIRMGLLTNGIKESDVDTVIAAMPEGEEKDAAKIKWEKSDEYHRDNPLIEQIGTALGLSEEQINTMWKAAEEL